MRGGKQPVCQSLAGGNSLWRCAHSGFLIICVILSSYFKLDVKGIEYNLLICNKLQIITFYKRNLLKYKELFIH